MIAGTVSANREAIIRISVQDADEQSHEYNAVLDTGFNGWLILPPELVGALGLSWQRVGTAILAMEAKPSSMSSKQQCSGTANSSLYPLTKPRRSRWSECH
jgi:predicted aspartyl protease